MNTKLVETIRRKFLERDTNDLLVIWTANNRKQWSNETFEAIRLILSERGQSLPPQHVSEMLGTTMPKPARPSSRRHWWLFLCADFIAVIIPLAAVSLLLVVFFGAPFRPGTHILILFIAFIASYKGYKNLNDWLSGVMAISHFRTLSTQEPDNPSPCIQLALWIKKTSGTYQEIEAACREALKRIPGHRDATLVLAETLADYKRPSEAIELLEPWLLDNTDYMGEILAARALDNLGRRQQAARHYSRAIEIFPKTPDLNWIEVYINQNSVLKDDDAFTKEQRKLTPLILTAPNKHKKKALIWMLIFASIAAYCIYDASFNEIFFNQKSPPYLFGAAALLGAYLFISRNKKIVADQNALIINGKTTIAYDNIQKIDKTYFGSKGYFTITYKESDGKETDFKISNKKYGNLSAILDRLVAKITLP